MIFPITLLSPAVRGAALALAIGLAAGAIYAAGYSSGESHVQAKWDAATVKQAEAVRGIELKQDQAMQEAIDASAKREQALRADYAAVQRSNLGLRDQLASLRAALPAAPAASCAHTADACLDVFGQCASQLGELAAAADGHAEDARKLSEAWVGR